MLTTQYLEEADQLADRIAVVDHGRVIADDTPAALKSRVGTVVELAMSDEASATRQNSSLHAQTELAAATAVRDHPAPLHDGSRLLISALHLLDQDGMLPSAVQVREPTLDEAFLRLTGDRTRTALDDRGAGPGRRASGRSATSRRSPGATSPRCDGCRGC